MLKTTALIAFGAAIALTLPPALAEMKPSPALAAEAPAAAPAHPTGSYRSEMRKRHNLSKERARASAEHMRKMRSQ